MIKTGKTCDLCGNDIYRREPCDISPECYKPMLVTLEITIYPPISAAHTDCARNVG